MRGKEVALICFICCWISSSAQHLKPSAPNFCQFRASCSSKYVPLKFNLKCAPQMHQLNESLVYLIYLYSNFLDIAWYITWSSCASNLCMQFPFGDSFKWETQSYSRQKWMYLKGKHAVGFFVGVWNLINLDCRALPKPLQSTRIEPWSSLPTGVCLKMGIGISPFIGAAMENIIS